MAVFRVEKNSGYTVMSNHHLRNRALSLKAKGLLSQMLSLPEDWDYTLQGLARINRESIDAIRQAIRELEQAGYIQRSRERDEKGRLRGADYVIFELPQPVPASVSPTLENPTLENPTQENPTLENPMQLNKDKLITEKQKKDGVSMDGRRGKMKFQNLSVKRLFGRVAMELVLSMSGITIALFLVTKQIAVLLTGGALLLCAIVGIFVLTQAFGKRLSQFTTDLCQTLDHMIAGNEAPQRPEDSETQLARIGHRLARLYQIMQENRRRVDEERQELQTLVSDISHQVKTPVSNLKMATDTLLEKPMTEAERTDFIRGIRSQTDKLDFLFQALVKTSRLETGVIQLDKKPGRLFDTVAQAMSGIVYAAEKKKIAVSVDCPENLTFSHDSKWTSEALFNLLDNAVKYTPAGGKITVSVIPWEMYVEIKVADTGKGISESNQAAIFRRFYREEEVHEQQGVGIGLYLAREIVTRQGGYIKVVSEPGKGSEFSIMLPTK